MSTLLLESAQERFDPAEQAGALESFLAANPAFRATALLDELRAREYGRLDARGEIYLDYTGGSLYAQSQLSEHLGMLFQPFVLRTLLGKKAELGHRFSTSLLRSGTLKRDATRGSNRTAP